MLLAYVFKTFVIILWETDQICLIQSCDQFCLLQVNVSLMSRLFCVILFLRSNLLRVNGGSEILLAVNLQATK